MNAVIVILKYCTVDRLVYHATVKRLAIQIVMQLAIALRLDRYMLKQCCVQVHNSKFVAYLLFGNSETV